MNTKQQTFTLAIFCLVILSTCVCILLKEKEFNLEFNTYNLERMVYLYIGMILSILSALLCIFKYYFKFHFYKNRGLVFPNEIFFSHPIFLEFFIEFIILIIHPSPFFSDLTFSQINLELKLEVNYYINDILVVIVIIKTLIHLFDVFRSSKYNSSRIQRINMLFNTESLGVFLPIKNYIANNLISFMFYSLLFSVLFFSSIILIIERPISKITSNELDDWEQVIWYVVITMTTIGYGDRVADTLPSRFFVMVLVIWGNFWSSTFLSSVFPYIEQDLREEKAFNLLTRIEHKKSLREISSKIISKFFKVIYINKKKDKNYVNLKRKEINSLHGLIQQFKIKKKLYNDIIKETHFFVDDVLSRIQDISNLAADQLDTGENIESNMKHIINILRKKMRRSTKNAKNMKKSIFKSNLKYSKLNLKNIIEKDSIESNSIASSQEEEIREKIKINLKKENIEKETKMFYAKLVKKHPQIENAQNHKETLHSVLSDLVFNKDD